MDRKEDSMNINKFIREHSHLSYEELAAHTGLKPEAVRKRYRSLGLPYKKENSQVDKDVVISKLVTLKRESDEKYKELLQKVQVLEKEVDAVHSFGAIESHNIVAQPHTQSEATAVVLASDFHCEETVLKEKVNGMNQYSLHVAKQRSDEFFANIVKLIKKEQQAITIKNLILWLGGDFISGSIHEELLENCSLRPMEAILFAQELIASGIRYLLDNTEVHITLPCSVGNHTRITDKVHISTEQGNSLEYFMYHNLAKQFNHEKRLTWIIAEGYHTYLKVYDKTLRFHHGHAMKYGGGVGGIYISVNKAIAQWNKVKWADLDLFGHFHQQRDGGNFLCNGSLIGYNTFSIVIKGDYEKPKQTFFLIDRNRGKTVVCPITLSH